MSIFSSIKKKLGLKGTKETSRKIFWVWITYQAVKGTLTVSFIWGPLAYYYFFGHGHH